jgi:hypothetical protein
MVFPLKHIYGTVQTQVAHIPHPIEQAYSLVYQILHAIHYLNRPAFTYTFTNTAIAMANTTNPPTDPTILSYHADLDDLTTTTLFAAQNRTLKRQINLARAIEALAPHSPSETERARLKSIHEEVTAKRILPDDVLIDILSDAVLQGGIDRLVLNRLLHNVLCALKWDPDRRIRSRRDRMFTHSAGLVKRVEVLLARGVEKAGLERRPLAGFGGGEERCSPLIILDCSWEEGIRRERIHALERKIYVLDHYKTDDAAIQLGVAKAAWHALRAEVCSDNRRGIAAEGSTTTFGPSPSRLVEIGAEFPSDGFALFRRHISRQHAAASQGCPGPGTGTGTELQQAKPSSRRDSPICEHADDVPRSSRSPTQPSPAVPPRTEAALVIAEPSTPSSMQPRGREYPTYPGTSIRLPTIRDFPRPPRKGCKAKEEIWTRYPPTKRSMPHPTQISRFFPPSPKTLQLRPSSPSRAEKDPEDSESLTEEVELERARAHDENPAHENPPTQESPSRSGPRTPGTPQNKHDGNRLRERWAVKQAKIAAIATSSWRAAPVANGQGSGEKRKSSVLNHQIVSPPRGEDSEGEGGVRLADFEVKKEVGEAAPEADESGGSKNSGEQEQEKEEDEWAEIRRTLQARARRRSESLERLERKELPRQPPL